MSEGFRFGYAQENSKYKIVEEDAKTMLKPLDIFLNYILKKAYLLRR